jgi:hypothetical protein
MEGGRLKNQNVVIINALPAVDSGTENKEINSNDRSEINEAQITRFFSTYYSEWRYIKIMGIKKMIEEKYTFFTDILKDVKKTDFSVSEITIATDITNGLLFDAVQATIQYIEDLFALLRAGENPDTFIKNIVDYRPKNVSKLLKSMQLNHATLRRRFYFAPEIPFPPGDNLDAMADGLDRLAGYILEIRNFYIRYNSFYNQYKHGLSVALRPFGDVNAERVEEDKQGKYKRPALVIYKSGNPDANDENAFNNGQVPIIAAPCMPVMMNQQQLQSEDNLLRYVLCSTTTDMAEVAAITGKIKMCLQIFIHNFLHTVQKRRPLRLRLPSGDLQLPVYDFTFK